VYMIAARRPPSSNLRNCHAHYQVRWLFSKPDCGFSSQDVCRQPRHGKKKSIP
jgi:hypothetical protein